MGSTLAGLINGASNWILWEKGGVFPGDGEKPGNTVTFGNSQEKPVTTVG